ncbi:hypothetical protein KUCAC02_009959, partial [Chaenocephalus aceratus]
PLSRRLFAAGLRPQCLDYLIMVSTIECPPFFPVMVRGAVYGFKSVQPAHTPS